MLCLPKHCNVNGGCSIDSLAGAKCLAVEWVIHTY